MSMERPLIILGHIGFVGHHIFSYFKSVYPDRKVIGLSFPEIDLTHSNSVEQLSHLFTEESDLILCSALKRNHGDNLETYDANMKMVLNVAQALDNSAVKNIVYFSSTAVYGEDIHYDQITEDTLPNVRTYYGSAKYSGEMLLKLKCAENVDKNLIVLRPPLIYGENDMSMAYGPAKFIDCYINDSELVMWGDGLERREFIYVRDVCEVIDQLIQKAQSCTLNLVSGQSYSFMDIVDILNNYSSDVLNISQKPRSKSSVDHNFDSCQIKKILPDFHFTDLKSGVEKIISTMLTERNL